MRYNGKAFAQRGIAQLVEQRSPKPRAEGSNPSAPAKAPADLGGSFFVSLKDSNPPAARAAVMPQGAALCGDRGGQMQRGPRSKALRGVPNPSAPAKALTERSELFCFRPPSCLPLTREVASPKGLTEGEIGRACCEAGCAEGAGCEFSPSVACGDSSLVRGSQAPREATCPSKKPPCLLDKAASGCYSCVSKNGCHCRGGRPDCKFIA